MGWDIWYVGCMHRQYFNQIIIKVSVNFDNVKVACIMFFLWLCMPNLITFYWMFNYVHETNNGAELKAIVEGLWLYKRLHMKNIIIKSDSKFVVHWIRKGRYTLWYHWDFREELYIRSWGGWIIWLKINFGKQLRGRYFSTQRRNGKNGNLWQHSKSPLDFKRYHLDWLSGYVDFLHFAFNCFLVCLLLVWFDFA